MLHNSPQDPAPQEKHPILFKMKMVADRAEVLFTTQMDAGLELPSPSQCRVLMYLKSRNRGPVPQRELEHHLGVSHTTVKGLLQRLEEKGFVRTAFDSEDGRVKNVYLAEYSSKLNEEAHRHSARIEGLILAGLSEAERRQLDALLERLYRNVLS